MPKRKRIATWGMHINSAISELIADAQVNGPSEMEFNGVIVQANADSDADLLYRDWDRAMSGYIASPVGPYPVPQLSAAELASDAEIKKQNELRWAAQDRLRREKQAREKAEYEAAVAAAPAMERDEVEWQKGIAAQKGDGYGLAIYEFAEAWARLMQKRISAGQSVADCAESCASLADKGYSITGFMYGCAVSVLSACWKHGEDLRRWHNLKTQIRDEGEKANESGGVLNPALLSVG